MIRIDLNLYTGKLKRWKSFIRGVWDILMLMVFHDPPSSSSLFCRCFWLAYYRVDDKTEGHLLTSFRKLSSTVHDRDALFRL